MFADYKIAIQFQRSCCQKIFMMILYKIVIFYNGHENTNVKKG